METQTDPSTRDADADVDRCRSRDVLEENVFLNLLRTRDALCHRLRDFFDEYGVTEQQYNVLRILYVRGEDGLPCQTIGDYLITRVPDVTRLLDRMEEADWVKRERSEEDRRVCLVKLTPEGERLCEAIDDPLIELHKAQFSHMSQEQLHELNELLMLAREHTD